MSARRLFSRVTEIKQKWIKPTSHEESVPTSEIIPRYSNDELPEKNNLNSRPPIKADAVAVLSNIVETTSESRIDSCSVPVPLSHPEEQIMEPSVPITISEEEKSPETSVDRVDENEPQHPQGYKLYMVTLALMLGVFVMSLDNTIITTAIPQITTVFQSLNDVGWYGSVYLLAIVSLQPTYGKIYTYLNVKFVFISSLSIFEVGSIVCATASNSPAFIVGRAVAGVGAAGIFSGGMTIIGYTVPLQKRPLYFAILASVNGITSLIGPPLGGLFVDTPRLTWRFAFWINLPIGGLAIISIMLFFQPPLRPFLNMTFWQKISKLDLPGGAVFISAIVLLLLALQWGGTSAQHPWSDPQVWGCLLGFGILFSIFIAWQFRLGEAATIPPRIISRRTIAASCTFTAMISMGLNAQVYYLPFYFQSAKGVNAENSGLHIIPYLTSFAVVSLASGAAVSALGLYSPFMIFGSAVFTIGSGLIFTLRTSSGAGEWVGYQILMGIGCGCTLQLSAISIQASLPPKDMPTGNSLILFFNYLGSSLSISIAQNIFSSTLLKQLKILVPQIDPATIITAGATSIPSVVPEALVATVRIAYDYAVRQVFILPIIAGGVAFLSTFCIEWRNVKKKQLAGEENKISDGRKV